MPAPTNAIDERLAIIANPNNPAAQLREDLALAAAYRTPFEIAWRSALNRVQLGSWGPLIRSLEPEWREAYEDRCERLDRVRFA